MLDEFADAAPRKRRKKTGEKATVETPACKWMKDLGWYCRKYRSIGNRSAPDRLFAKKGHVIFVEFKAKKKKPTELQLKEHAAMRAAGLTVWVFDDLELFKTQIRAYEDTYLC